MKSKKFFLVNIINIFLVTFLFNNLYNNLFAGEKIVDGFEILDRWNKITSSPNVFFDIFSVSGKEGNGLLLKFDFNNSGGYVVISKDINLVLPQNYKFSFFIKGDSPENNLEFKLVDKEGNVFWKKFVNYSFPKDWTKVVIKKRDIQFAWGPNPEAFLDNVSKIEFAISCGSGGKGEVYIDELTLSEIEDTTKKFNITVTASSVENDEYLPQKVVDGKRTTRWSSMFEDNQWLLLDLGKEEEIVGLVLDWENAYGKVYDILVSKDNSNWVKVYSTDEGDGGIDDINFKKQKVRYIKINLIKRGTPYGFSLYEIKPKSVDQEIFLSASSFYNKNKIENILDGDKKTFWQSNNNETQWVKLDLQKVREYGGIFIYWDNDYALDYDIFSSNDDKHWNKLYSVTSGNGGVDKIFFNDAESRFIKIVMKKSSRKNGYKIKEIELKGPEEKFSPQKYYEILAEESPKGFFPKYFLNQQTYWTIVGVNGDEKESLINEEGTFEVDKEKFSIEPFIYLNNKLITWADVKLTQELEKKYLPIPTVLWEYDGVTMTEKLFSYGKPNFSTLIAWYRIKNNSPNQQTGKIFLAIRPFQVNPPWQNLNMQGGVTKIESIDYNGEIVKVNNDKKIVPLIKPDNFGATTFTSSDIVFYLKDGKLPKDNIVKDENFYASAAMEYNFDLSSGEYKDIFVAVPFYNIDLNVIGLTANMSLPQATEFVTKKFNETVDYWDSKVSNFEINLPQYDQKIVDTIKSNLAYILINKDGARIQPGSRSYNRSWIRDGAMTSSALLKMGLVDEVREFIDWYSKHLFKDGKVPCAVDSRGADPCPENDSNGEFIYLCKQYYNYTKDKNFLQQQLDNIIKSADYIIFLRNQRKTDEYKNGPIEKRMLYGLVPESISHEGYSAKPMHSYWDDFWSLKGLKDAVKIMEIVGEKDLAKKYKKEVEDFRSCIYNSMRLTMELHNIDYLPGCAELGDFDATSTSIGIYPCDEFDYMPKKELYNTMEIYYRDLEKRFIPNNNWGEAFTPYELRTVRSFIYMNEKEKAHKMLEYFFTVQRPLGWNHWAEVVWRVPETPKFIGDMPHTWVGSDYINSARSLFVLENENDDTMLLFKGFKDKWLENDNTVWAKNLPTVWGLLDFDVKKVDNIVTIKIAGTIKVPKEIILSSPISKPIKEVKINGKKWKNFSEKEVRFKKLPSEIVIYY